METKIIVRDLLNDALGFSRDVEWQADSALLGVVPELDSMTVVTLLTGFEENLGIAISDDEIDAEVFESFGSLCQFIEQKLI